MGKYTIIDKSDSHIEHTYICREPPVEFQTARQKVVIGKSDVYGEMLFIDDEIQSTTSDEKIYHSVMAQAPFQGYGPEYGERILICGSAEGCLLREIQKMNLKNAKITMVDWDAELVEYFKGEGGRNWNMGAFQKADADGNLTLLYEDVFQWIKGVSEDVKWDIMYVDLIDPDVEYHGLYLDFLVDCQKHLSASGRIILNHGEFTPQMSGLIPIVRQVFPDYNYAIIPCFVPSYMGIWNFLYLQPGKMNMSFLEKISALRIQWNSWSPVKN